MKWLAKIWWGYGRIVMLMHHLRDAMLLIGAIAVGVIMFVMSNNTLEHRLLDAALYYLVVGLAVTLIIWSRREVNRLIGLALAALRRIFVPRRHG